MDDPDRETASLPLRSLALAFLLLVPLPLVSLLFHESEMELVIEVGLAALFLLASALLFLSSRRQGKENPEHGGGREE